MLDFGFFPQATNADVQMFWGSSFTGLSQFVDWHVWEKPRGKDFLAITALSSGGGGGGGCGGAGGGAKGGGGGGGSSGISLALWPMIFVPDRLHLRVGDGGTGGAGGSSANGVVGIAGQISWASVHPQNQGNNHFIASNAVNPQPGGAGTNATGGAGGAAGTINPSTSSPFVNMAISRFFIAGVAGVAGGAQTGAVGTSITISTSGLQLYGGAGGGGSTSADFAGGDISGLGVGPFITSKGGAAGGNPGSPGFLFGKYPIIYGGSGGGASNSVPGGEGGGCGNNAPGAGGGGGGAGVTTGGRGGNGGPGLVIMTSF